MHEINFYHVLFPHFQHHLNTVLTHEVIIRLNVESATCSKGEIFHKLHSPSPDISLAFSNAVDNVEFAIS